MPSTISARVFAALGASPFAKEKMDSYNPAGVSSQASSLTGFVLLGFGNRTLGTRLLRAVQSVGAEPGPPPGSILRVRQGLPGTFRHRRHLGLFLLPPRRQAQANGPHARGPPHHHDHLHADDHGHDLRRRVARGRRARRSGSAISWFIWDRLASALPSPRSPRRSTESNGEGSGRRGPPRRARSLRSSFTAFHPPRSCRSHTRDFGRTRCSSFCS